MLHFMTTIEALLKEIEAFLREVAMAETTFGRHAVNDGKFVGRLREGGGVTVATIDRVRAYMEAERPKLGRTNGLPTAGAPSEAATEAASAGPGEAA